MKLLLIVLVLVLASKTFASVDAKNFRPFLYSWANVSTNPDAPDLEYWTLDSTDSPVPLAATQLRLWVMLMLNEDGTYLMTYTDGVASLGSIDWKLRACFNLEGKWAVPAEALELYDANGRTILQGTTVTEAGVPGVRFNYLTSFPASEISGKSSAYTMGQANYPPGPVQCQFPPPPLR